MEDMVLEIIISILMVLIAIALAVVITYLYSNDLKAQVKGKYKKIKDSRHDATSKNIDRMVSYRMVDEMLLKNGAKYRMGKNFSPFDYTMLRLFVATILGILGLIMSPLLLIAGVIIGYLGVPFYFRYENKYENDEMMDDLVAAFGIVSLQLKNGVYISKVIYECYLSTMHPRLKQAFLELSMEIEKFGSVKQAATSFRSKFENKYIDSFSKTLEQADETGSAVDLLDDLESQIDGINEAIAIREEAKIGSRTSIVQTLVFLGAMLFVAYIMVVMFSEAGSMVSL